MQRPLRALVLVVAATYVGGCSQNPESPLAPASVAVGGTNQNDGVIASTPAPRESTATFEQAFMKNMIDHHQMAIEMAEICLQKAVHEELRSTCENIISTQSAEIRRMQGWLQDWYGVTYTPTMKPGAERDLQRLGALSGEEFEIAFMESMIAHHEGAIREARECTRKAYHKQLLRLCESIISAQSAEIAQMERWLCDWYGRCGDSR